MPSRKGINPTVYVNGSPRRELIAETVEQSLGGRRLDHASISYDLDWGGDILQARQLFMEWAAGAQYCEIAVGQQVVHWGAIGQAHPQLGGKLTYSLVSRTEPFHFGGLTVGPEILTTHEREPLGYRTAAQLAAETARGGEPSGPRAFVCHEPIVFNPLLDGRLIGNRSVWANNAGRSYFFDVDQSRTANAILFRNESNVIDPRIVAQSSEFSDVGLTGQYWTLAQAVHYLCWTLNPDQEFVRNPPNVADLERILTDHGQIEDLSQILRNEQVRPGIRLPEALDTLLSPRGFSWFVEYGALGGGREIKLIRLGQSERAAFVGHQRRGAVLDPAKSNVEELRLSYDISSDRMINAVQIFGAHLVFESSFELMPAWDAEVREAYPDWDDMKKGGGPWEADPRVRRLYRDWVLGEAGDYVGNQVPDHTLPDSADREIERAFDFNQHLGLTQNAFAMRRRRFLETITLGPDGKPAGEESGGVSVEWYDEGLGVWNPIGMIAQRVISLEQECGVRFDDEFPPKELVEAGRRARIRITASVVADIQLTAFLRDVSIQGDLVQVDLQLPDEFVYRLVHSESKYRAQIDAGELASSERDDTLRAILYCSQLVKAWNRAECAGEVILDGIDFVGYRLGDSVQSIQGRDIGLSTSLGYPGSYPTIAGISYDVSGQRMTLTLDTFREASV